MTLRARDVWYTFPPFHCDSPVRFTVQRSYSAQSAYLFPCIRDITPYTLSYYSWDGPIETMMGGIFMRRPFLNTPTSTAMFYIPVEEALSLNGQSQYVNSRLFPRFHTGPSYPSGKYQ